MRRHGRSAWQLAVVVSGSITAATDIAARGLLLAISTADDSPPNAGADRSLLLRSVRRCALEARVGDTDDLNGVVVHQSGIDHEPVVRVFAELPEAWRSALWLATIEQLSPGDLTAALDLDAHDTHLLLTRVLEAVDRRAAAWDRTEDGATGAGGRVPLAPASIGAALGTLGLDPPADLATAIPAIWDAHGHRAATIEPKLVSTPAAGPVDGDNARPSRRARLVAMATGARPRVPAGAAVMVLALSALAIAGTGGPARSGPTTEPTKANRGATTVDDGRRTGQEPGATSPSGSVDQIGIQRGGSVTSVQLDSSGQPSGAVPVTGPSLQTTVPPPPPTPPTSRPRP